MDIIKLPIETRTKTGSAESRRLRRAGRLPGILYGLDRSPVSLTVSEHDFQRHFERGFRVFDLQLDGKHQIVLLKDMQVDALTDQIVHLDFARVDENASVEVSVALEFVGEVESVAGAFLDYVSADLHVKCLPRNIPASLEVSLTGLAVGGHIRAKDVVLPNGVNLAVDGESVVVNYSMQREAEEDDGETPELEVLTARKPVAE